RREPARRVLSRAQGGCRRGGHALARFPVEKWGAGDFGEIARAPLLNQRPATSYQLPATSYHTPCRFRSRIRKSPSSRQPAPIIPSAGNMVAVLGGTSPSCRASFADMGRGAIARAGRGSAAFFAGSAAGSPATSPDAEAITGGSTGPGPLTGTVLGSAAACCWWLICRTAATSPANNPPPSAPPICPLWLEL